MNVASSTDALEDFVNLDNHIFLYIPDVLRPIVGIISRKYRETVDKYDELKKKGLLIRHDCRKSLFFPDNSVDHILCSHFLEHVFPVEMEVIVSDFHRVMKPGATLHVIVPDLRMPAEQYLLENGSGDALAADRFIGHMLLSRVSRGSWKYRLLELLGAFGLEHKWMYDQLSMTRKLQAFGFGIVEKNESPSRHYRLNDGSVHIVACKQ